MLPTSLRLLPRLNDIIIGGLECQQVSYNTCIGEASTKLMMLPSFMLQLSWAKACGGWSSWHTKKREREREREKENEGEGDFWKK
jgi:hypothetical protein